MKDQKTKIQVFLESLKEVEEKETAQRTIKSLVSMEFSGSNDDQGKAVQLLKALAFSDDPAANKFMKDLNKAIAKMDPKLYS